MEVLSKSLHIVDHSLNISEEKELPKDITNYIDGLLYHINNNKSTKKYLPESQEKEVVNCTKQILKRRIKEDGSGVEATSEINVLFQNIANRLLKSEADAQEKVEKLGVNVKRGSLLQALVYYKEYEEYTFFLAKVNHTEFVEDDKFTIKSGFPKKENIWKSCQFKISMIDDSITIESANIYFDYITKFWTEEFLELKEAKNDELNTLKAFEHIDTILSRNIKKTAPRDWIVLRNQVIGHLRSSRLINYEIMIQELIANYEPTQLNPEGMKKLTTKLLEKPEKWNFDPQFISTPSAITAKIKKVFPINQGIELKITDSFGDIKETIKAVTDPGGKRYIKILTDNDETYNLFK